MKPFFNEAILKKPYQPQPGTIAHRVIEFLKSKPAGSTISSGELAEFIEIDKVSSLMAFLKTPVSHGLLNFESAKGTKGGGKWSLGDGIPPAAPAPIEGEETDPAPPVVKLVPAAKTKLPVTSAVPSVFDLARQPKKHEGLRLAYFNDGSLTIDNRRSPAIEFTPAESIELFKFLARIEPN